MVSACTSTPKCLSIICMLAAAIRMPTASGPARCTGAAPEYTQSQVVPEPPSACGAPVPLPFLVPAVVPPVAGILLFPTVWTRQILLLDINLLAEEGLGRYGQRVFDRRHMPAPAPLSGGVVRALACVALARKRYPAPYSLRALGGHSPAASSQGLDLALLLVCMESAAHHTVPRHLAFPGLSGILASYTCHDPMDCLRS